MNNNSLTILWTSGDPQVAEKMVFMYTLNAKKRGWWDDIKFIIWGPSSKLLSESGALKDQIKEFIKEGITIEACKACADQYSVSADLAELGINVKYMGEPLTKYIKEGHHIITF
jgi:hypothetical protein